MNVHVSTDEVHAHVIRNKTCNLKYLECVTPLLKSQCLICLQGKGDSNVVLLRIIITDELSFVFDIYLPLRDRLPCMVM